MLLLVGAACLFPVSLYCLFLAMVHQRRTPTMIAGVWDFAGVLLALSGFLLVGTSVFLLSLYNHHARAFFLEGGTLHDLVRAYRQGSSFTFLLWTVFFVTLGVSLSFALWQRRMYTVVYHLTTFEAESLLHHVLERLRLTVTRRGPRWFIGYDGSNAPVSDPVLKPIGEEDAQLVRELDDVRKAIIDVEGSTAMRYATLHWRFATPAFRMEIENELSRDLANFPASEGSIGAWLMTATAAAFILMLFMLVTFLILSLR